jgi:ATP-dependent RNA helicase UAP56/SUB2
LIGVDACWLLSWFQPLQVSVFYGGTSKRRDEDILKNTTPHIVVGTPGRLLDHLSSRALDLSHLKFFILDECDKMLGEEDMRSDVIRVFKQTPIQKQVMMYSATLPKDLRTLCKKFMRNVSCAFFLLGTACSL